MFKADVSKKTYTYHQMVTQNFSHQFRITIDNLVFLDSVRKNEALAWHQREAKGLQEKSARVQKIFSKNKGLSQKDLIGKLELARDTYKSEIMTLDQKTGPEVNVQKQFKLERLEEIEADLNVLSLKTLEMDLEAHLSKIEEHKKDSSSVHVDDQKKYEVMRLKLDGLYSEKRKSLRLLLKLLNKDVKAEKFLEQIGISPVYFKGMRSESLNNVFIRSLEIPFLYKDLVSLENYQVLVKDLEKKVRFRLQEDVLMFHNICDKITYHYEQRVQQSGGWFKTSTESQELKQIPYLLGLMDVSNKSASTINEQTRDFVLRFYKKDQEPSLRLAYAEDKDVFKKILEDSLASNLEGRCLDYAITNAPFGLFGRALMALDKKSVHSWREADTLSPEIQVINLLSKDQDVSKVFVDRVYDIINRNIHLKFYEFILGGLENVNEEKGESDEVGIIY